MSNDWKEESLKRKYAPLPEDGPRHRKRFKKRHVRSDHKHVYEEVAVDAHLAITDRRGRRECLSIGRRCKVCGRLDGMRMWTDVTERPEGMRLFEVDDFFELVRMKVLPEEREVSE